MVYIFCPLSVNIGIYIICQYITDNCCVDVKDIDPAVLNYAATKLQALVSRFFFSNSVARLQWFISSVL
jgi:hypothetical protein